ncbi:hypothetical protein KY329_00845 [Candidatus Woesearchaeota archaeon]|nr:hypothetical protein [Candidatus Woesearchaeota archaeon]
MNVAEEAYAELFGKNKEVILEYSGRYKEYNARITMTANKIKISMSKAWRGISRDIQKGLVQELMVRLFDKKINTIHMDLYSNFIKSLPKYTTKTKTHPVLEQSFIRVNSAFFGDKIEQPNLKIGNGVNQLGKYEYATDTVTISRLLLEKPELLDYVMYHELLHKKHKFKAVAGRHSHHTAAFRRDEKSYPGSEQLEKELEKHIKNHKKLTTSRWYKPISF